MLYTNAILNVKVHFTLCERAGQGRRGAEQVREADRNIWTLAANFKSCQMRDWVTARRRIIELVWQRAECDRGGGEVVGDKPDQHSRAAKLATSSQQTATSCCSSSPSPKPKPKTGPKPKPKSESRQMLSCCCRCCCCDFNIFIINDKYFDSHNNWHVIEAGLGCCLPASWQLATATCDSRLSWLWVGKKRPPLSPKTGQKMLAIFSFILACLRRTLAFSLGCFVLLASTWRPLCSEQMILIRA